jgi:hypothetical protein
MILLNGSVVAATFVVLIASAQPLPSPAVITQVEGQVYVDGQPVAASVTLGESSVVHTQEGRVEVRLRNGLLFLGKNSSIRIVDDHGDNFHRLAMIGGSAIVTTAASGSVVCEDSMTLSDAGVFRFDLQPIPKSPYGEKDCRTRVYKGVSTVQLPSFKVAVKSGKMMGLNRRCGDMIPTQEFNLEDIDDLNRWSQQRIALSSQPR